jgi:hypothetical protein
MQGDITDHPRTKEHKARRGVATRISPSSPARELSDVERGTRASGTTSTDVIRMMNQLRKTNR